MLRNKSVAVAGGDMRQFAIYEQLLSQNNNTALCAFEKYESLGRYTPYPLCADTLYGADIVILPLPAFTGGKLNTMFSDESVTEESLVHMIPKNAKVFGGKLSKSFTEAAKDCGIYVCDYMQREEFAVLNAVPTAEGAIALAIEHTSGMICHSRILVCGFGRIGKILSQRLLSMGAQVCVSARKPHDLAWISAYGMTPLKTGELLHDGFDYDIIINTIPEMIFDKKMLSHVKNGCVIIDLASLPGGVDIDSAKDMGLSAFRALSLPGKVAPAAAGRIILSTIENILDELEVIE